jgi:hypothetical protein
MNGNGLFWHVTISRSLNQDNFLASHRSMPVADKRSHHKQSSDVNIHISVMRRSDVRRDDHRLGVRQKMSCDRLPPWTAGIGPSSHKALAHHSVCSWILSCRQPSAYAACAPKRLSYKFP